MKKIYLYVFFAIVCVLTGAAEDEKTALIENVSFGSFKSHFEPEWVFGIGFSRIDMSAAKSNVSVNAGIRGNYYFKTAKKGFFHEWCGTSEP